MPCSIWMPPCASGPVLTVNSPIRAGAPCAMAGAHGKVVRAVPARNVRRLSFHAIKTSHFAAPAGLVFWRSAGRRASPLLRQYHAERYSAIKIAGDDHGAPPSRPAKNAAPPTSLILAAGHLSQQFPPTPGLAFCRDFI